MNNNLKPYEEYKKAKQPWLKKIPVHWKEAKSKRLFLETSVKNHPHEELLSATQTQGVIPRSMLNTRVVMPSGNLETFKLVREGNFVISLRSFQGGIEYSNYRGIVSPAYNVLQERTKQNKEYYKYLFKSHDFIGELQRNVTGIRQGKNIDINDFKEVILPIPPIGEQDKIVKYLNQKISKINKFIKLKKKLIAVLKEQKQLVINEAVTKGLNRDMKMKFIGNEWISYIPNHWEVKKMKYLGRFINGYAFPSEDFIESGIRVIKISNIQTMNIDWTDKSFVDEKYYNERPTFRVLNGDLVLALTRPIISTGIKAAFINSSEKILLNQRNAIFRADKKLSASWLYYILFNSDFIKAFDQKIDKTGQQPNISTNDIQNIPIPLPSIDEQNLIVRSLESKISKINKSILITEKEIDLISEFRIRLISDIVTGKVDVRNIDVDNLHTEEQEIEIDEDEIVLGEVLEGEECEV